MSLVVFFFYNKPLFQRFLGGMLALCMLTSGYSKAQTTQLDSLVASLDTLAEDSQRAVRLLALGSQFKYKDHLKAYQFSSQALELSQEIGFKKGEAEAYVQLGAYSANNQNLLQAVEYTIKALNLYRELGQRSQEPKLYIALGLYYSKRKMEVEAMDYFGKAERVIFAKTEEEFSRDNALNAAHYYHEKARALCSLGKDAEGLKLLEKKLELATEYELGDNRIASTLNNMGNIHFRSGNYEKSYACHTQSYQLKVDSQSWYRAATSAGNIGEVCTQMGKLKEASRYLKLADEYGHQSNNIVLLINNIKYKALLAKAKGEYQQAFDFIVLHHKRRDSLNEASESQAVTNLLAIQADNEKRFQMNLLEAENAKVQAENEIMGERSKRQNSYFVTLFVCLGFLLLLIGGLVYYTVADRKKKKELKEKNEQIKGQLGALNTSNAELENLYREQQALVQIVIHDLKAPLNKTLGLVNMMDSAGELNPAQTKFVELLRRVNQDAGSLVNNLVELNALEAGGELRELKGENATTLLSEVAGEFAAIASQKAITIKCNQSDKDIGFRTRRGDLVRILDNLISNALKFSPQGKTIEVGLEQQGDELTFWVKDEGPGIGAEDQEKMFRKFQRLSARPTGGESSSGLGLSIVKALVERLNGTIKVNSTLGKGAEFRVTFPLQAKA